MHRNETIVCNKKCFGGDTSGTIFDLTRFQLAEEFPSKYFLIFKENFPEKEITEHLLYQCQAWQALGTIVS